MRQWMVDPEIMCRKHLLGEHLEHHMFAGAINKGTSMGRFLTNNLLEPASLQSRHDELVAEMKRRGYNHKSTMPQINDPGLLRVTINKTAALTELLRRCPECLQRHNEKNALPTLQDDLEGRN